MNRYKINTDGSYTFYTFNNQAFNKDFWLNDDGRFTKDADGKFYEFYNTDGTPDIAKNTKATMDSLVANYKSLYLGIVDAKLKDLDYDSLATVKLWEGDAAFGTEAARILTWYKAIINRNYELQTAGNILTDIEYLTEINSIVY